MSLNANTFTRTIFARLDLIEPLTVLYADHSLQMYQNYNFVKV